jgi:hypothetical protein
MNKKMRNNHMIIIIIIIKNASMYGMNDEKQSYYVLVT